MDFTDEFKTKLKELINMKFKKNELFDSHTIINLIIQDKDFYHLYLENYPKSSTVKYYHSEIAKEIERTGLVETIPNWTKDLEITTLNIFREPWPNKIWRVK